MSALKVGDVIEADDRDYRYGIGLLILRVTRVDPRQCVADTEWLDLEGLQLRRDGTQVSPQPRPVCVRAGGVRLRPGTHDRP